MPNSNNKRLSLILILGSLTALSPFSIDMYLSAFPQMAQYFKTDISQVSLTLSSYFIGIASGQLFYGPLMDRFGRIKPLYAGLLIYALASIACSFSHSIDMLIVCRFLQAVGGCAASVGAFAMVRDLFSAKESAKVFSMLILVLSVSPLLAPTFGGYLTVYFGWSSIFYALAVISLIIFAVVAKYLPESHKADKSHVLKPIPIIKNYYSILKEPHFYAYAISGAIGFSGLFVYLASSPIIFMEIFKVSEQVYGWIFAIVAMGMVGMSQVNVVLLKRYSNQQVLFFAISMLVIASLTFLVCAFTGFYNVYSVVATMFVFLSCLGLSNPNSAALAMAQFGPKAGSAAALLGFLQMSLGAIASFIVGILKAQQLFPLAGVFVATSILSLAVLYFGTKKITTKIEIDTNSNEMPIAH